MYKYKNNKKSIDIYARKLYIIISSRNKTKEVIMIRIFQIAVDGVDTEWLYEAETPEEAIKACVEDGAITSFDHVDDHVEAILYDEYEE